MPFNQTIPQAFRQVAARHPGKTAVVYLGDRFSYARVDQLSDRFALALVRAGGVPGLQGGPLPAQLPGLDCGLVGGPQGRSRGRAHHPHLHRRGPDLHRQRQPGAEAVVCMDRNYGHVVQAMEETSPGTGRGHRPG